MKISIAPPVFQLAPEFIRFVLLVENASNAATAEENPALLALLRQQEEALRCDTAYENLKNHPRLASWRELFSAFGVNPNQCPPSVANLIKRIRAGKDMPFINTAVCIFTILSLEHAIPAGGDDLDAVTGDLALTAAHGDEQYIPLGSTGDASALEHPKPGEIILVDTGSDTVLCRAWCWKNGDTTKIQPGSSRIAVNLDILPPVTRGEGEHIARKAQEMLQTHCNATVSIHCLDKEHPGIVL